MSTLLTSLHSPTPMYNKILKHRVILQAPISLINALTIIKFSIEYIEKLIKNKKIMKVPSHHLFMEAWKPLPGTLTGGGDICQFTNLFCQPNTKKPRILCQLYIRASTTTPTIYDLVICKKLKTYNIFIHNNIGISSSQIFFLAQPLNPQHY